MPVGWRPAVGHKIERDRREKDLGWLEMVWAETKSPEEATDGWPPTSISPNINVSKYPIYFNDLQWNLHVNHSTIAIYLLAKNTWTPVSIIRQNFTNIFWLIIPRKLPEPLKKCPRWRNKTETPKQYKKTMKYVRKRHYSLSLVILSTYGKMNAK